MPGLAVLTTVRGRLPGGSPVPLLPPLDELALAVVQAADTGTVLVGGRRVQHGDAGSPPACNRAAASLSAALPGASIPTSGQGARPGLAPCYPLLPPHHPRCYGAWRD